MGKLIRSMDWSKTPLGPVSDWPQSLRTSVSLCLSSTFPILIAWGPETIQIYNDSYRPICGAKHPESMGQNFRICWETALPVVGDAFARGQQGEGTYIKDQRMFLDRYGYLEEAFMTFSFAPIRDESGEVGGIFHPITETTDKMLSARRTQVLRDVAAGTGQAKTNAEIYAGLATVADDFALDLPFLLLYELQPSGEVARLVNTSGLTDASPAPTELHELVIAQTPWLADLEQTRVIPELAETVGPLVGGPYPDSPHTALRLPIQLSGNPEPVGFILAGVSPHRALDQEYLNFYALLANTLNTAFSNVHAYQEEQKRAEALAAIDQAKTAFFSNISHEFRTPLTLMLGPLDELKQTDIAQSAVYKEPIEQAHRNAGRLLKLVNNLLDFSRIEAGRVTARFQPVDLSVFTVDLASSFRSLLDKAGLDFIVDCPPLPSLVYVDTDMWEKIVLNLLSNAFKYTLQGTIGVHLYSQDGMAILRVSDTGVGIPAHELPHMFERFHRVEQAGGRTHEGTGIGLSLVSELVHLHQGKIEVDSVEGEGSTFTVRIPMGSTHLPAHQVSKGYGQQALSGLAAAFLEEAQTMLPAEARPASPVRSADEASPNRSSASVLVVDDNADMRAYLVRLLEPHFTVRTAVNGAEALQQLLTDPPQLILSDLMMPVMDGSELLRRVKQNPATSHIPLIFLSARAGQEARIDGLEAGADDYLVKPFAAPELLTKVRTQIDLSVSRRQAEIRFRNLIQEAPFAIGVYSGRSFKIDMANEALRRIWDKPASVIGMDLIDALPELEGQPFIQLLERVYDTGVACQHSEEPAELVVDGQRQTYWFNSTCHPLTTEQGQVYAILNMAVDVTQTVVARRQIEDAKEALQQAVELAELGTWELDMATDRITFSDRLRHWHGILPTEPLTRERIQSSIRKADRDRLQTALQPLLTAEGSGQFDVEYYIETASTGQERILRTQGKVMFTPDGVAHKVRGTVQDITQQRNAQLALEKQVHLRTEELYATNEELAATNEELAEANEDFAEANRHLIRSNQNLEQFAYIASHDLQEPLRKIQQFSDLLKTRYGSTMDEELIYVDRMQSAAQRMSRLIKDLLAFSRISTNQANRVSVSLRQLVDIALDDLAVAISESQVRIEIGPLPTVQGDPSQLGQLLQNLLSNAIKFSRSTSITPQIQIHCTTVSAHELPPSVKPTRQAITYQCLQVADNGIGFDEKYTERIFQVFQRLHGKNEFAGTGVGLAICEKVVANHGGAITANSQPGQGATFRVYLP